MAKNILVQTGSAMWAKVFEPDTKFNPDGDYTINIQMAAADAAPMCEQLEQIVQAKFNEAIKEDPRLKNTLTTQPVMQTVYDRDTGDDTGNVEFKFKLKAKVRKRDGTYYEQQPAVLDAKKTPLSKDVLIGNGSKVKVAFEPIAYVMPSTKKAGVSLRLKAVQVIDLIEFGSSATSVFDEEDGYVAAPAAVVANASTKSEAFDDADF
jgi:hypothetical protein|tara:strand:- start:1048 stop:1668 length:621 start_codon:yes stop_codon:yes gene_type:complete